MPGMPGIKDTKQTRKDTLNGYYKETHASLNAPTLVCIV